MLKKITTQSTSNNECVEIILRGARKRRRMAYDQALRINSEAGIRAKLSVIK